MARDEKSKTGVVVFTSPTVEDALNGGDSELMLPYLMTTTEVAEFFGVNRTTVYRWEKQGLIEPQKYGNTKRYLATDIKAFADQRAS